MSIREPRLARNVYSGVRVHSRCIILRTLPRVLVVGNLIFVEGGIGAVMEAQVNGVQSCCTLRGSRKRVFFYLCYSVAIYSCWRRSSRADTSTLEGTVKDKQGLTISDVQIQVVSAELAIDRSVTRQRRRLLRRSASPNL